MARKKKDVDVSKFGDDMDTFIDDLSKLYGNKEKDKCDFFVSTGSTLLDYIIANQRDGGVPGGRIIEISGDESTGKTVIASHIAANTQNLRRCCCLL